MSIAPKYQRACSTLGTVATGAPAFSMQPGTNLNGKMTLHFATACTNRSSSALLHTRQHYCQVQITQPTQLPDV